MFEDTVHFQTIFENKYPSPGRGSALGAPPEAAPGYFFKLILKTDSFFQDFQKYAKSNFQECTSAALARLPQKYELFGPMGFGPWALAHGL